LQRFFREGSKRGIDAGHAPRIGRILDRLDTVPVADDMNVPGLGFHELKGDRKGQYSVSVSGNWRITFRFENGDAYDVNLEDYH
jgi:proteic killer suppression protein